MLIDLGMVEGVGPRNGTIRFLRMTEPTPANMAQAEIVNPGFTSRPGSIITEASREVYREHLPAGYYVWNHKATRML